VIAKHSDDGNSDHGERLGHLLRLLGIAPIGQVATEREHVGVLGDLPEEELQCGIETFTAQVNVTDSGDSHRSCHSRHDPSIQR
jgi:hypothetical protein